jgi:phenylpropionate dioxygenase-like ring-hydroxylating dioxygenase large terminal subunit
MDRGGYHSGRHQHAALRGGRILKDSSGVKAKEFRCPYHAWAWALDGTLKEIPTEWDFPGVRATVGQLPCVQTGTWGVHLHQSDLAAGPLEEFLGPVMMDHYRKFNLQNRYKQAHVQRIVSANWKIVMEARAARA